MECCGEIHAVQATQWLNTKMDILTSVKRGNTWSQVKSVNGSYLVGTDSTTHTLKQSFIQVLPYWLSCQSLCLSSNKSILQCQCVLFYLSAKTLKRQHTEASRPTLGNNLTCHSQIQLHFLLGFNTRQKQELNGRFKKKNNTDIDQDLVKQNLTHILLARNVHREGTKINAKSKVQLETYVITLRNDRWLWPILFSFFYRISTLQQIFHFHRVTCSVVVTRLMSCHPCSSLFSAKQTEVPACAALQGNVTF